MAISSTPAPVAQLPSPPRKSTSITRVSESFDAELGAADLFANDIAAIAQIIRDAVPSPDSGASKWNRERRELRFAVPGYELDPEDFKDLPHTPKDVTFSVSEPSIRVRVYATFPMLSITISGSGVVAKGVAADIREYLDAHCRRPGFLLVSNVARRIISACTVAAGAAAIVVLALHSPSAAVPVLFFGAIGIFLTLTAYCRPRIFLKNRAEYETWWQQHGAKAATGIITGVVVAVVTYLITHAIDGRTGH